MTLVAAAVPRPLAADDVPPARPRRRPRPGTILLLVAIGLFLACGWGTISAPFSDSHDGRNAGVWASGARALREDGPVQSRLGGLSTTDGVYATHPPLIYVETAVAEMVGGDNPAATRAPAWIGSLVAIVLLARLLRERGLSSGAAAGAVCLIVATPMLLVYGTMLDTPVTSLPFALGLVLLWERARSGRRPVRPVTICVVAALCVLAGWQALLVAGAVGAWAVIRLIRGRAPGARSVNLAVVTGAVVGLVALLLWQLWAFGWTLRPLLDQFDVRTGQTAPAPIGGLLAHQQTDLVNMFGLPLLVAGTIGLVLALRDRRTRVVAVLGLAVTVSYILVFRDGALAHDYWDYWLLFPLAVGVAALLDRLGREVKVAAGVGLIALVTVGALQLNPSTAERFYDRGVPAGRLVASMELDPAQDYAWYAGVVVEPASWLSYATRRPAVLVPDEALTDLAAARPTDQVLVGRVVCARGQAETAYALELAAAVAADPPAAACP